jgi:hypothetical protein
VTKGKTKRVLVLSDTHCGSTMGLMPPRYQSDDTRDMAGPLWGWYIKTVRAIGSVDVLLGLGDFVDGPGLKDQGNGHVTTDTEEQAQIAVDALSVIKADRVALCYGTPYHTVSTYSAEGYIARELGGTIKDSQYLGVNGRRISARHVVGRSDTPYGQGTLTHKELVRDLMQALQDNQEPADIVIRAHVHTYMAVDDGDRWGIVCPCLQLPGSVFGRTQRPWRYRVGLVLLSISSDSRVDLERKLMPLDIVRRREYVTV